jgi:hypothetical protein
MFPDREVELRQIVQSREDDERDARVKLSVGSVARFACLCGVYQGV